MIKILINLEIEVYFLDLAKSTDKNPAEHWALK
jgi:hypothetical protein